FAPEEEPRRNAQRSYLLRHRVRESAVDAVLDRGIEGEAHALRARPHAERYVVAQALRIEVAERALVAEVGVGLVRRHPGRAPIARDARRRHAVDQPEALHHPERRALPPPENGRVEQDDRAEQRGARERRERGEVAAQRMPDAEHRLAVPLDALDQLVDQVRPAVGDRMARVVAQSVDEADPEAGLETREHLAVARRRESVGVGEMQNRQAPTSLAVIVYLKLSGSRLSPRPWAVSACGYMKKVSLPLFALGRTISFAVLNASQFISQAPK